jgi:hypothetical protein
MREAKKRYRALGSESRKLADLEDPISQDYG